MYLATPEWKKTGAMSRSVVFVKWERCIFWCIGILCIVTVLEWMKHLFLYTVGLSCMNFAGMAYWTVFRLCFILDFYGNTQLTTETTCKSVKPSCRNFSHHANFIRGARRLLCV